MQANIELVELFPRQREQDRLLLVSFLTRHGLRYEENTEYACAMEDDNGELIGCGCADRNILKCFALDDSVRGIGILPRITAALQRNRFALGYSQLTVYTIPENRPIFEGCGFFPVVETSRICMLENRQNGVERTYTPANAAVRDGACIGAVIMNANPFTRGHLHLLQQAASQCELLYVFVLEEDISAFPFADRFALVVKGTADISNAVIRPGGPYIISADAFPTYFMKAHDSVTALESELDLRLFGERIAPAMGITVRFVGSEPLCAATATYNETMKRILPAYGIETVEIPRLCDDAQQIISATTVRRRLLSEPPGPWLSKLVPPPTLAYLMSPDGAAVISNMKNALNQNANGEGKDTWN